MMYNNYAQTVYLLDTQAIISLYHKGMLEHLNNNSYLVPMEVVNELTQQQLNHRHGDDGRLLVPGQLIEQLWSLIGSGTIDLVNVGVSKEDIKNLEDALREHSAKKNSRVGIGDAALLKLAYILSQQNKHVTIVSSDSDIEEILGGYHTQGVDVIPSEAYLQEALKA
ncbi:MAG: hypothetical protein J7K73_00695 [Nanoarchaeota archaeon]|nr:hypothetical protein [Nanoarchaeota archaeon]